MTIAFEIIFQRKKDNSIQEFLLNLFSFYSEKYPEINFLLLSNNKADIQKCNLPNQQFIHFSNSIIGKIKLFFVQEFLLDISLKKRKVKVLICANYYNCKNKLGIKSFSWINDLSALKKVDDLSDIRQVFCTNDFIRSQIAMNHLKNEPFTHLSRFCRIEKIQPATFEQKEKIKDDYSNGKEYFLFYSDEWTKKAEFVSVMKAFSLFKKWQKSNMQLILIIDQAIEQELSKLVENYKHKEDVRLILNNEGKQFFNLLSACYGCIMGYNSSIQSKMIHAIKLNIPMIVDESDFNKSSFANACVYTKMDEIQISQKMILLYKDELFREQIINATKEISDKLNWDCISDNIWYTLTK